MGFWDNVAGNTSPAPAVQPQAAPQQPADSTPWWMAGQAPQATAQAQPAAPGQPEDYHPRQARSAALTDLCPECGSVNCFRPMGQPNAMPQCYECGWNPRFGHSTAGAGMPSLKDLPVHAARQAGTDVNNFNGQTYDPAKGGAGKILTL